jgi:amino acid permease
MNPLFLACTCTYMYIVCSCLSPLGALCSVCVCVFMYSIVCIESNRVSKRRKYEQNFLSAYSFSQPRAYQTSLNGMYSYM